MDQPLKKTKDSRKHSCFGLRDATLNPEKYMFRTQRPMAPYQEPYQSNFIISPVHC